MDIVARSRTPNAIGSGSRAWNRAFFRACAMFDARRTLGALDTPRRPDLPVRPPVMRWSNAFAQQSDVATELARRSCPGATIILSVLEGREVFYLAARNSSVSHSLIQFRPGMRLPAAFTATGKAFLSQMSDFEVRRLYADGLPEPRTQKACKLLTTSLLKCAISARMASTATTSRLRTGSSALGPRC